MEFYDLSYEQIGNLMYCIKIIRMEQEDNLLIWEKKYEYNQGFCMEGENGWNELSAEDREMDYGNKMQMENYDNTQDDEELEEGELEEQEIAIEQFCSYCRGLRNYCWCNWVKR